MLQAPALGKIYSLDLLDKTDHITTFAAAEAFVDSKLLIYRETRTALIVKRAEAEVVAPVLFQGGNILPDNGYDVQLSFYLVNLVSAHRDFCCDILTHQCLLMLTERLPCFIIWQLQLFTMANAKKSFWNHPDVDLVKGLDWDKPRSLAHKLTDQISTILEIDPALLELKHPADDTHGDYALNEALKQAKEQGKNPRELAEEMVAKLKASEGFMTMVAGLEVAGPGFINIRLKPSVHASYVSEAFSSAGYAHADLFAGKTIMFEYAHPNPFKVVHIGHLRNMILGESLIRILESYGANIIRVNYQGDVGMHIAKNLWALLKVPESEYPEDISERAELLGRTYAEGATAFKDDPETEKEIIAINKKIYSKEDATINRLWETGKQWSLDKFAELYERLYMSFERQYMESETLPFVDEYISEGLEKNIFKQSQGAVVFDGEPYGLDTRVFLNSEGLPTYEGKELGLARLKQDEYGTVDLHIHNVAIEQISFFEVTFKAKELLMPEWYKGRQYHNAYEFVGLKSGKMSSRTGQVVFAETILDEAEQIVSGIVENREGMNEDEKQEVIRSVGTGAVKYSFLNLNPGTYLAFDLQSSVSLEGNSGPYIQYTYARARRMLDDAGTVEAMPAESIAALLTQPEEQSLMRMFAVFEEALNDAVRDLAPNALTGYVHELAQRFNLFYRKHSVLNEENPEIRKARLVLTQATANVIGNVLDLLGIRTVSRM
ncbi:MAG: Arginine--tRNA ligase [candidate division WS6 bacterium OLB20]|uniref:Arginine--tRNA ligase n=1 Tax=candidate division WS6 bacterium OLB20 TaxID=1617426 RepID=A0A136LZ93_9BACT|nr:MAG: Arginine--tRNA ligase [candidate division WS6 bacterium OLB20]